MWGYFFDFLWQKWRNCFRSINVKKIDRFFLQVSGHLTDLEWKKRLYIRGPASRVQSAGKSRIIKAEMQSRAHVQVHKYCYCVGEPSQKLKKKSLIPGWMVFFFIFFPPFLLYVFSGVYIHRLRETWGITASRRERERDRTVYLSEMEPSTAASSSRDEAVNRSLG